MKWTEKLLLDNYSGLTNGLHRVSTIDGADILWNYRRGDWGDGYNPTALQREDASEITLEYDHWATVELDEACAGHPALERMENDYRDLFAEVLGR